MAFELLVISLFFGKNYVFHGGIFFFFLVTTVQFFCQQGRFMSSNIKWNAPLIKANVTK